MKLNKLLLAAFGASLLFVSCNNDDDNKPAPLGSYENGVLVLNEGGFGTVTYASDDLQAVQQDIFGAVNGTTSDLGQYDQSMFFDGDRAFIISNGSNKITVVNRYTFQKLGEITTGLTVPRYGVVYNGKAYVTNSNSFTSATDDFIAVINLSDLSVDSEPIQVNDQAERLIEQGGKLYVSGGFYGSGNNILVVNPDTKSVETTIDLGQSPNSLEYANGFLYALCSGFTGDSKIVKINLADNSINGELLFPTTMGNAQNLDLESDKLYFTVGPKIYRFNATTTAILDTPFIDTQSTSDYIGYGFAVHGGRIYISEAADDFTSDGHVLVYSTGSAQLATFASGLGPNGFYFND